MSYKILISEDDTSQFDYKFTKQTPVDESRWYHAQWEYTHIENDCDVCVIQRKMLVVTLNYNMCSKGLPILMHEGCHIYSVYPLARWLMSGLLSIRVKSIGWDNILTETSLAKLKQWCISIYFWMQLVQDCWLKSISHKRLLRIKNIFRQNSSLFCLPCHHSNAECSIFSMLICCSHLMEIL